MTTHAAFASLLWLVALGYVAYLAWFLARMVRERRMRKLASTTDSQ